MIVPDIGNPFFPLVVRGAEDAAQKHGYNLLLCNSDDSLDKEEKAIELLLSKRVDGILLTKAAGDFRPPLRQMIKEVDIPFVLVMRTYPKLTKDAVITDDYHGAYEAVSHLARAGRKRIGLISGPLKVSNAKERWQGFHDALKAEGLSYEQDLVIEGDYRLESGFRAGHSLLSRRPDGIYVANHLMTIGLLQAAEEMGLPLPGGFLARLVSFDDYPCSWGFSGARVDHGGIAEAPVGDRGGGAFDQEDYGGWQQSGFEEIAAGVADSGVVRVWVAGGCRRERNRKRNRK